MSSKINTQVIVLGSGPGGYSAAFRCADLGLDTIIVERHGLLGGVCLNVGCIPSKALLHIAKVIEEAKSVSDHGVIFNKPKNDIKKIRTWKENVVNQITSSLASMAKARKVKIINGYGRFISDNELSVEKENKTTNIRFENAIIATGSHIMKLPFIPYTDPRIWNSTDALSLKYIPNTMLIIGGGIIGLEMATVYHALGSKIDIAEICNQIIPEADKDIVEALTKSISIKFNLMLETKITSVEPKEDGLYVSMDNKKTDRKIKRYDVILVAVGRIPNGKLVNAKQAGIKVDDYGFISVDKQMRTNVKNIYAIGDIIGQPMLAHKASYEGHVAAEVIAGKKHFFDPKVIPYIAYTNPEIAWTGITENQAKNQGISYKVSTFPWSASGRAIASSCEKGITKLLFDKNTNMIIGGAVVGTNGGEIIGEISLAIEMGCYSEDIAMTIHAHPTLYESIGKAAEVYEGTVTDLPNFRTILRK